MCDNCAKEFRVKNSAKNHYIHCEKCRCLKLGSQSSKKARLIGEWLKEEFEVEFEKSFDWFYDFKKPKGRFKLDFYLPKFKIGIEFDGEQHFKPSFTGKWESVGKVRYRDRLKEKLCKKHNINIIRFNYNEKLSREKVLMKIYAELQGNELVEVRDKKLLR
jgi:very-short-patch-repair endonuclease